MKSDIVTEVLWIISLVILLFLVIFVIVPRFWRTIAYTAILSSPEVVIKDVSGLITISGAAPHTIEIKYDVKSQKYSYNLHINGRILEVEMLTEQKIAKQLKKKVKEEIPIDPHTSVFDTTIFNIEKYRDNGKNVYEVFS